MGSNVLYYFIFLKLLYFSESVNTEGPVGRPFRILVYSPRMMESHVNFMARIANVLADRGHEVTVIDSVFRYNIGHGLSTNISTLKVLEVPPSPEVTKMLQQGDLPTVLWKTRATPEDQRMLMEGLGMLHRAQCVHLAINNTIIEEISTMGFDFAIHEVFDACGVNILEAAKIEKSIIVSSTAMFDIVSWSLGIQNPLHEPALLSDYGSYISLWNWRRSLKFHSAMLNYHEMQDKTNAPVFKKLYGVTTSSTELMRKTSMVLTNTFEKSDAVRFWGRRIHDIGGIAFKDSKPLSDEYRSLLATHARVAIVSFGTAATSSNMPSKTKEAILQAMKQFNDTLFIWKYETEDDFSKAKLTNVVFKKFLPQIDLLNSGKVSLFITHCGQNSLLESFQSGTRTLAIPLFGDQHRNAHVAQEAGLVNIFAKEHLADARKLAKAIEIGLASDERINKNLQQFSASLRNAKSEAEQELIRLVEKTFADISPANFRNFPRYYHPNTMIIFIDVFLATVVILSTFAAFKILKYFPLNEAKSLIKFYMSAYFSTLEKAEGEPDMKKGNFEEKQLEETEQS